LLSFLEPTGQYALATASASPSDGIAPQFRGDVAIGSALRYIDKRGSVSVGGGRLVLRRRSGEVIVDAPARRVNAVAMRTGLGAAARIWIAGERYTIEVQHRPLSLHPFRMIKDGRELMAAFLHALEAEGGRLDKP